jgi:hypothetical protein
MHIANISETILMQVTGLLHESATHYTHNDVTGKNKSNASGKSKNLEKNTTQVALEDAYCSMLGRYDLHQTEETISCMQTYASLG